MEENSSIFHEFNTEHDLSKYLNRSTFDNEENGKYDFEQCVFNFDVNFNSLIHEFDERAVFINARFKKSCSFERIIFAADADFNGCVFESNCNFRDVTFRGNLTINSFSSFVSFNKVRFNSDTFWGYNFKTVDFSYCTFAKTLDLSERTFDGKVHLNSSIFHDDVYFENSTFKDKVNAWETIFKKNVTFKWANFKDKINLTESTIKGEKCNFYGSNFEGNAYFYKTTFNELDLKNSVIEKGLFFLGAKVNKAKRETNRIIKNEFIRQNNKIEALKYHAFEMEAYKVELIENRTNNKSNYSFWDYWILKINKLSNNYGRSPGVGLTFTLTMALTFFLLYYLSLKDYPVQLSLNTSFYETYTSIGIVAGHFIEFINPAHKVNFLYEYLGSWSIFIDYFSRIFIGFGIYQLIQSFRKYGRL